MGSLKYPHYEPLNDPNLKNFFQSPSILDVVRKTLNIDLDERLSDTKKRSRTVIKLPLTKKNIDLYIF